MGKKDTPTAPTAPDPAATAAAQTQTNIASATAQANLNRINQVTPQGNLTYSVNGTNADGTPKYTQTQTLSPDEQKKYDLNNQVATSLDGLANSNVQRVADAQSTPFSYNGMTPVTSSVTPGKMPGTGDFTADTEATQDAVYKQAAARLDPQWQNNDNDVASRLAAQGISENSDAYRRAMTTESNAKTDAYNQANYSAISAGDAENSRIFGLQASAQNQDFNQQQANATLGNSARQQQIEQAAYLRNMPLNDIATLLGTGSGVTSPSFTPVSQVGVAAPDYQGAVANNYNQAMSQYNQQQQAQAGMLGSIFGAAGSIGSALLPFSDIRLKKNIKRIGTLANGLATYAFNYIGDTAQQFGVMAQEALKVVPDAVVCDPSGYLRVNYGKVY